MTALGQDIKPREPEPESWGELGPAMKALPNEKWRDFVRYLVRDPAHGGITRSYVKAGFGKHSRPTSPRLNLSKSAFKLCADVRIINAIAEESRKVLRIGHPEAVNALWRWCWIALIRSRPGNRSTLSIVTSMPTRRSLRSCARLAL
jgi:hypothetical protein